MKIVMMDSNDSTEFHCIGKTSYGSNIFYYLKISGHYDTLDMNDKSSKVCITCKRKCNESR